MTIIERLNTRKNELQSQCDSLTYSSVPKSTLNKKIKILDELIDAYGSTSSPIDLSEAEKILNQQVGFEEEKKKILKSLKIGGCWKKNDFQRNPLVFFLIGPPGVGKTTFAKILAQTLKKEYFAVALGGISDISMLLGNNESSLGGADVGQLTKALIETKTHDPLILLDEFDKVNSYNKGNSAIHNCLNSVLDPVQNKEILEHYLDVKLDFSRITFVITVNDQNEIPKNLLSRMPIVVKLSGYTLEQKKEIAQRFIQTFFANQESLKDNFEITSQALETLINKTREKGVRQLKKGLDDIFDYCLLQWAEEVEKGKPESKITVDSDLVHAIIPHDFPNIDLEDDPENKSEKKELENLRRELAIMRGEKNNQTELKAVRFNSLLVLRKVRNHFNEKEYQDYEGKINTAASREEIEVVVKEFLLKIKQKNTFSKPSVNRERERERDEKIRDELAEIKRQNKDLGGKLKPFSDEIKRLKKEIKNLQNQRNQDKTLLTVVIIILVIWGIYGILKLIDFFRKAKSVRRK